MGFRRNEVATVSIRKLPRPAVAAPTAPAIRRAAVVAPRPAPLLAPADDPAPDVISEARPTIDLRRIVRDDQTLELVLVSPDDR
jgi:hypothetical protein